MKVKKLIWDFKRKHFSKANAFKAKKQTSNS